LTQRAGYSLLALSVAVATDGPRSIGLSDKLQRGVNFFHRILLVARVRACVVAVSHVRTHHREAGERGDGRVDRRFKDAGLSKGVDAEENEDHEDSEAPDLAPGPDGQVLGSEPTRF